MSDEPRNDSKNEKFLPAGQIIDNRFEIKEPIRKTSGCIVYRARDRQNELDKAILIIPPIIQADFEAMDALRESAQLLKWLNHPYIARYYGLHTAGEFSYFEMEFVSGKSIKRKKFESPDKRFSENMAKWGALQILEGLSFAHNQNILHRNIKPQKIIFTSNGQVRMIDFGISDALRNAMAMVRDVTSRSAILFMPPEQIKGRRLSIQSDIYSLGATLYYLLDGKPPFHHGDIYYQILNEKPAPVEGLSPEFNYILQICLAKDVSDRFETCDQMIREIKRLRGSGEETKIPESEQKVAPPPETKENKLESPPVKKEAEYTDRIFDDSFRTVVRNKMKQHRTLLFWISLLLIIVISSIAYNALVYDQDTGKKQRTPVTSGVDPNSETALKMIKALNDAADVHFGKNRFITPAKNNAYELYQEALKIDPTEKHALSQIEQIKSKYYKSIRLHLNNFMLTEAENEIKLCQDLFKDDQAFQNLEREYAEKMQAAENLPLKIEILNGAGVAGIAKILSNYLKNQNFTVILTENYREKGQLNWNVRNTQLIGSIPENQRVKQLSSLLNIDYTKDVLKNKQSKQANILLIIGSDYKKITPLQ